MSNNNFIIWSYLEHPIRVEETNTLSKTYTHRCEPSKGRHDNLITSLSLRGLSNGEPVAISFKKKRLLRRFAPRNDSWGCHYEPAEGGRNICLNVIARLPAGKPWQSQKDEIASLPLASMGIGFWAATFPNLLYAQLTLTSNLLLLSRLFPFLLETFLFL